MAKLKIHRFPDPILTLKAHPIARVDRLFWPLVDNMLETMYDAPGIGLAANQVGILKRILVLDVEYRFNNGMESAEDTGSSSETSSLVSEKREILDKNPIIIINPEIVLKEGSFQMSEGCLSVPEYFAEVKRFKKIKINYQDQDGKSRSLMAEDLLAVAIQHEIDHLEGKLFIDRLSSLKKETFKRHFSRERILRDQK